MARMWMVRGEGGSLYDSFREREVAAIGWAQLAPHAKLGIGRKQLMSLYQSIEPQMKQGTIVSGASQVWRFVNEIQNGDWVITYSPANRLYLVGTITGMAEHHPEWAEQGMALARKVQWQPLELSREKLGITTKNSLGSTLTVFEVPARAAEEVLAALKGGPVPEPDDVTDEAIADPLADIESQAVERIKDRVSEIDWDEMQHLVAGILRAMGYKTQVSPPGSDRGKDIVASPDGFGFENPRIVVEVKHRKGQMGSQDIRSFLGGRHKDDRGLYVSTGGFSKDALYEADRASIPLSLWTLDHVVRALIEHYDATDAETKRIVPLKRLYWPA
ncbi:restriction endonuclease [Pseudomonas alkylphenolica]|uniref:Restriction endonuclease n=1 Tax=Pseudomonas alkylphenolica TaxID=237609 RepID=A0A077F6R1_9PSED|nr:restriction endonuclease [Pseudomonas alkylphenolica]AIL61217.1 Restriction endonuclease [Pseudomonas alkylphenolica]